MVKATFTDTTWVLDHLSPEKIIEFKYVLEGVLRWGDKFFVILKPRQIPPPPTCNIMCFDRDGKKLWDIQDPNPSGVKTSDEIRYDVIWDDERGGLCAHAGSSEYLIDACTGSIIQSKWTK